MLSLLTKPQAILTHESDLDGFLSGVLLKRLAQKLYGVDVPIYSFHYNEWRQRQMRETSAWVADFCYEPRLDKQEWVIIDHHPYEGQPKNATIIFDSNKSASLLCYELCKQVGIQSEKLDRLIHYSNVADLFLQTDPDFTIACDYANLVKTYGFWNLLTIIDGRIEDLIDHPLLEVMEIKRKVEDPIGFSWSSKNIIQINNQVGVVETIIGNNNLIINRLLDEGVSKYPVLMTLYKRSNGLIFASIRSRNGEALKIAEILKGGGHPNACGAVLPKTVRTFDDAIEYLKKVLNPSISNKQGLNSLEAIFENLDM
jgi:oligoribonuclease NrnB/cAMP/cGMP phosphodiesterase (DHH superfamily)